MFTQSLRRVVRPVSSRRAPMHPAGWPLQFRCILRVELLEDRSTPSAAVGTGDAESVVGDWLNDEPGGMLDGAWYDTQQHDDELSQYLRRRHSAPGLSPVTSDGAGPQTGNTRGPAAAGSTRPPSDGRIAGTGDGGAAAPAGFSPSAGSPVAIGLSAPTAGAAPGTASRNGHLHSATAPGANPALMSEEGGQLYLEGPSDRYNYSEDYDQMVFDVPLNANNDNGSTITDGIPAMYDFAAANLPVADPQLIQLDIRNTYPSGYTYTLSVSATGDGAVTLWKDPYKNETMPWTWDDSVEHIDHFYVEGTRHSSADTDVTISITYSGGGVTESLSFGGGQTNIPDPIFIGASFDQAAAVTPKNIGLIARPAAPLPNIRFVDVGADGPDNIVAGRGLIIPGITFEGSATMNQQDGQLVFIHNILDAENGANGTTFNDGTEAALLYKAGNAVVGARFIPAQGAFPLLDLPAAQAHPEYPLAMNAVYANGAWAINANDAPRTGQRLFGLQSQEVALDYCLWFRLYLVLKQANAAPAPPNYIPLTSRGWAANFYATGPGPLAALHPDSKVTAGADPIPPNSERWLPPVTGGPIANGNLDWQPVI